MMIFKITDQTGQTVDFTLTQLKRLIRVKKFDGILVRRLLNNLIFHDISDNSRIILTLEMKK